MDKFFKLSDYKFIKKSKLPDLTMEKNRWILEAFLKFIQQRRKKNNSKKTKLPDLTLGKNG